MKNINNLSLKELFQDSIDELMELFIAEVRQITGDYEWLSAEDEYGWTAYGAYVYDIFDWYLAGHLFSYADEKAKNIHPHLDGNHLEQAIKKTIEGFED